MAFDKIKEIIVEQLGVEESAVAMDTNLMKDLEADWPYCSSSHFGVFHQFSFIGNN